MQRPLFGPQVTLTIEWQVDAFSNADSGDASQQQSIGIQGISAAQFLLKPFIIFGRQRPWEILRTKGKIFANNETGVEGMALDGQIIKQAAKAEQMLRGYGYAKVDPVRITNGTSQAYEDRDGVARGGGRSETRYEDSRGSDGTRIDSFSPWKAAA